MKPARALGALLILALAAAALALLGGGAEPAQAHPGTDGHTHSNAITCNNPGNKAQTECIVPQNWIFVPAPGGTKLGAGSKFRILFVSTGRHNAREGDINVWNARAVAEAGRSRWIKNTPMQDGFRALVSTYQNSARGNTGTGGLGRYGPENNKRGITIWWAGGEQIGISYLDFYDATWGSNDGTLLTDGGTQKIHGTSRWSSHHAIWTGTGSSGEKWQDFYCTTGWETLNGLRACRGQFGHRDTYLGSSVVWLGTLEHTDGNVFTKYLEYGNKLNASWPFYVMSPLLTVGAAAPVAKAETITAEDSGGTAIAATDPVGIGDKIIVEMEFQKPNNESGTPTINVSGTPTVALQVGAHRRTASYVSGDGTSTLRFEYTVVEGDLDTDGVSLLSDSLSATGGAAVTAMLPHGGHNSTFKVDGIRPYVKTYEILRTSAGVPASDKSYTHGDKIRIKATFNEQINDNGTSRVGVKPRLRLVLDNGANRYAALAPSNIPGGNYDAGSATSPGWIVFEYEVKYGDLDGDGFSVGDNGLELNGGVTIKDTAGHDMKLTRAYWESGHEIVDRTPPTVSRPRISSSPGNDGIYTAGERIVVRFNFSEPVTWSGSGTCRLDMTIGGNTRTVDAKGKGSSTLTFVYTVVAEDKGASDADVVLSIGANKLKCGAELTDLKGNALVGQTGTPKIVPHLPVVNMQGNVGRMVNGKTSTVVANGRPSIKVEIGDQSYYLRTIEEGASEGARVGAPVTASDPDGDELFYTLDGPDASRFTIDASGQIKLGPGPTLDFEDASQKTVYLVQVNVSDKKSSTGMADSVIDVSQYVRITVLDVNEAVVVAALSLPVSPTAWFVIEGESKMFEAQTATGGSATTSYRLDAPAQARGFSVSTGGEIAYNGGELRGSSVRLTLTAVNGDETVSRQINVKIYTGVTIVPPRPAWYDRSPGGGASWTVGRVSALVRGGVKPMTFALTAGQNLGFRMNVYETGEVRHDGENLPAEGETNWVEITVKVTDANKDEHSANIFVAFGVRPPQVQTREEIVDLTIRTSVIWSPNRKVDPKLIAAQTHAFPASSGASVDQCEKKGGVAPGAACGLLTLGAGFLPGLQKAEAREQYRGGYLTVEDGSTKDWQHRFRKRAGRIIIADADGAEYHVRSAQRVVELKYWVVFHHRQRGMNSVHLARGPFDPPATICLPKPLGAGEPRLIGWNETDRSWSVLKPATGEHPSHLLCAETSHISLFTIAYRE